LHCTSNDFLHTRQKTELSSFLPQAIHFPTLTLSISNCIKFVVNSNGFKGFITPCFVKTLFESLTKTVIGSCLEGNLIENYLIEYIRFK
jgi:hypothetical protein